MSTFQILAVFAGIVVTAVATITAAKYTSRSSVKAKEIDVKATAYSDAQAISAESIQWLRDQVNDIKSAHKELKDSHEAQGHELASVKELAQEMAQDLLAAVNWFEQFLQWEQRGANPPRPHIPAALRKRINQALLIEQRQEQIQHNREDN